MSSRGQLIGHTLAAHSAALLTCIKPAPPCSYNQAFLPRCITITWTLTFLHHYTHKHIATMSPLPEFLFDIARNPVLAGESRVVDSHKQRSANKQPFAAVLLASILMSTVLTPGRSGSSHRSWCYQRYHHRSDLPKQLVHGERFFTKRQLGCARASADMNCVQTMSPPPGNPPKEVFGPVSPEPSPTSLNSGLLPISGLDRPLRSDGLRFSPCCQVF